MARGKTGEPQRLTFRATIHDTAAALRFGGDGAFLTLAIPESDAGNAVALIALKKTALRVTIEVEPGIFGDDEPCQEEKHTATKRARR